ncbi:restriction endonuclease subunit S [Ruegeria faecimaris]|uniref:restriction endonuclease subunit S n=1 Tax=Ruegeria faecimaris TaxID=686389 RepID=UPI002491D172|nr:restriction endonuclease subunit S [Ruegeria faecimaris]
MGDIPKGWSAKKLKFSAKTMPSNVDKKTKNGEVPVQLCNYTDVYYGETVSHSPNFMKASATLEQVEKFTLLAGDTIITKDSEDPNDIAIPAFVPDDLTGVVCGYHLSIIRPFDPEIGAYLKRCFEAPFARSNFAVSAKGLTRYGLGTYAIDNVVFPIPPKEEAVQIASFLNHETAKIDDLIAKQQRLIALLEEKRQAAISHAVTKGLNPDAPMRDAGIDWLGDIPAHWKLVPLLAVSEVIDPNPSHRNPEYVDEGFPFISTQEFVGRDQVIIDTPRRVSEKTVLEQEARCNFQDGSIVFSRKGTIGATRVLPAGVRLGILDSLCVINPKQGMMPEFLANTLTSYYVAAQYGPIVNGAALPQLSVGKVRSLKLILPPENEQIEIVQYLDEILMKYEALNNKALSAITLLQERRTALISAAVTGKIDVRDWRSPADSDDTTQGEAA